jgi:hypothetical protein
VLVLKLSPSVSVLLPLVWSGCVVFLCPSFSSSLHSLHAQAVFIAVYDIFYFKSSWYGNYFSLSVSEQWAVGVGAEGAVGDPPVFGP